MEQLSLLTIVLCALLFIVLGMIWIVGYNVVKRHSPENLPKFYLLLAVIRIVIVLTVAGIYIVYVSDSMNESKAFAIMLAVMYTAMMALTLKLKH
ncbi:MAG: hypothetical protein WCS15_00900 [Prevotella sp.]|nr:hypothetical protein [Prevotella sp.]